MSYSFVTCLIIITYILQVAATEGPMTHVSIGPKSGNLSGNASSVSVMSLEFEVAGIFGYEDGRKRGRFEIGTVLKFRRRLRIIICLENSLKVIGLVIS